MVAEVGVFGVAVVGVRAAIVDGVRGVRVDGVRGTGATGTRGEIGLKPGRTARGGVCGGVIITVGRGTGCHPVWSWTIGVGTGIYTLNGFLDVGMYAPGGRALT